MSTYVKYGKLSISGDASKPGLTGCPVPQISVSLEYDRDNTGKILGIRKLINLEGQLYSASGSGGFNDLTSMESGLREAFKVDGQSLSIGCGNSPYISGNPKITNYVADKSEDYWSTTINYSVDLEIEMTGLGPEFFNVSSVQDDWTIETMDDNFFVPNPFPGPRSSNNRNSDNIPSIPFNFLSGPSYPTYRVSRTLGAVGKYVPTGSGSGIDGITNAKKWIAHQLATGVGISGAINGLTLYNYVRSVSANQFEGSYSITDTFLGVPSGSGSGASGYLESFTVETSLDNTYLRTVTINGTIKGLDPVNTGSLYGTGIVAPFDNVSGIGYPYAVSGRVGSSNRFENAVSGYSGIKSYLFSRCSAFTTASGSAGGPNNTSVNTGNIFGRFFGRQEPPLNPLPVSITEGFNPSEGTVNYSWSYNNRPLNLVSGSISETLTVNDNFPAKQIAEIFVLGRRLGPVIQDLGTYTSASRDVTFEVTFLRPTGLSGLKFPTSAYKAITGIIESFNPMYLFGLNNDDSTCKSFVKSNTENWAVSEGRFVKSKSWAWTKCDSLPDRNPNLG